MGFGCWLVGWLVRFFFFWFIRARLLCFWTLCLHNEATYTRTTVEEIWAALDLVRVYTKKRGEDPNLTEALVLSQVLRNNSSCWRGGGWKLLLVSLYFYPPVVH
jgi:hypothetical protein